MKQKKHISLLSLLMILVIAIAGSACNLFAQDTIAPTTADGYTALRDPFGTNLNRWYMARPFAARGGESEGSWPADIYITADGQTADVYPIATGKVVAVSNISSTESWRGQFVIIEHSGQFRLPSSTGTHVNVSGAVKLADELEVNAMNHLAPATEIFSTSATMRHDFTSEPRYTLNEGTATTVYSVYKNLSNVSVKIGQSINATDRAIGRVNMAPTQPTYIPSLELEIRSFGNREVHDAAFNVVLGPSGDGSFADVTQMLGFGYIEPSSFIQANLDVDYYLGLDPLATGTPTPLPTSAPSTNEPGTTLSPTDATSSSDSTDTTSSWADEEVVQASDAEIASLKRYINEINNYFWMSEISTIPSFVDLDSIDSVWVATRFMMAAARESTNDQVSLEAIERLAQAKLNPNLHLDPDADYSTIALTEWDASNKTFTIIPAGLEDWVQTNDLRTVEVMRQGNRFTAEVYELNYVPIHFGGMLRNIGLIAADGRYVGFYDHDNFDVFAGNTGSVFRYELSGDSGSLDRFRYTIEADENGRFTLVSKSRVAGSSTFRDSLLAIEAITIQRAKIANTGGMQLRVRSGPSTNAAELGLIPENSAVIVIGPPSNGFNVIFDPRDDGHAPTGFASTQYIRVTE